jgi:hypothetical protein
VNETVLPPHHHHRKKKETRHECKNRSPPSAQKSLQLLAAVYRLIVPLDLCVCVCVDPFPPFRIRPSITRLAQSPATRAHTGREPLVTQECEFVTGWRFPLRLKSHDFVSRPIWRGDIFTVAFSEISSLDFSLSCRFLPLSLSFILLLREIVWNRNLYSSHLRRSRRIIKICQHSQRVPSVISLHFSCCRY